MKVLIANKRELFRILHTIRDCHCIHLCSLLLLLHYASHPWIRTYRNMEGPKNRAWAAHANTGQGTPPHAL